MKSHPTGNQWLVIWALLTLLRTGTCSQTVSIGRFEIESSCSVFRLNYLKEEGGIYSRFSLFVVYYALEIEKLCIQPHISGIFNQQLQPLNFNYL